MKKLFWETKQIRVADLVPLNFNPRTITEEKRNKLIKSLEKFNLAEIPAVNTDLTIIGGNQRVFALMICDRGEELIDVRMPSRPLTEAEVKEYAIISNTHAGEWDVLKLEEFFSDVDFDEIGFDLNLDLFENEENQELYKAPLKAEEDDYEIPEEIKTDIVLGDLFEIGPHRLLCGDSTCSDTVAKLMNGEKADMVFTDPPYLMDFKGNISWDKKNGTQPTFNSKHGKILNDKKSKEDGSQFLDAINSNIKIFCNGCFYITFYRLGINKYFESLERVGLKYRSLIIWNKLNHTLSNSDYMSMYEPIFYGWVNDHNFYGGKNGRDIWDIKRTLKNDLHPTMKPIELLDKALNDGSKLSDLVLDLFLGSGSTMVAAHQLKRKCFGLELDPKYCQVILDRMRKTDPKLVIKRNGEVWN